MTFREVTSGEILAALGDGGEDPVLRACVAALRAYPRPSYAVGGSPASNLRETLEVKYRHAASRGKTFLGDGELLLRLRELRTEPVAVVSAHGPGKTFCVYVTPSALEPVGAVIMYDAQRDEVAGDLTQCQGTTSCRRPTPPGTAPRSPTTRPSWRRRGPAGVGHLGGQYVVRLRRGRGTRRCTPTGAAARGSTPTTPGVCRSRGSSRRRRSTRARRTRCSPRPTTSTSAASAIRDEYAW
jgi:hypothetical protein